MPLKHKKRRLNVFPCVSHCLNHNLAEEPIAVGATSLALGPLADRLNRVNLLLAVVILGSVPCALIKCRGDDEVCNVLQQPKKEEGWLGYAGDINP